MIVVLMGVSGCGKTTIGKELAERLSARFVEGDAFHSPANIEKMTNGTPLTELDREPWLQSIRNEIEVAIQSCESLVVACSALTRKSRELLGLEEAQIQVVYLDAPKNVIANRLANRDDHFMPQELLDSQFDTLQAPTQHEAIHVDATLPMRRVIELILKRIPIPG